MFRFQTGSIKRSVVSIDNKDMHTFRFQTGSIKSAMFQQKKDLPILGFRFQTGSIKSHLIFSDAQRLISFDSKLVRLKVATLCSPHSLQKSVSIPNWFD